MSVGHSGLIMVSGHFLGEKTIQERLRLKGYVITHTQAGQQIPLGQVHPHNA